MGKRILVASYLVGASIVFATAAASARQLFAPYLPNESVPTGKEPESNVADFDGDGRLDLICVTQSGMITTHRGDGFGGFTKVGAFDLATLPKASAVGDTQGDGIPDVVVLAGNNVRVLLSDGAGQLVLSSTLTNLSAPKAMALGDVDHDGRADLALSFNGNIVRVYRATPSGSYASTPVLLVPDGSCESIAIRDVTGDGHADVLCVAPLTGNVNVFQGTGLGTFAQPLAWFAGLTTARFSIADLDGDGVLDLICPRLQASVLSVLRGLPGGSFANLQVFPMGFVPREDATVVDLDGDGVQDVVVTHDADVLVMKGGPPGFLAAPTLLDVSDYTNDVDYADFDGDLDEDLALGLSDAVFIAENLGDGTFPVLPTAPQTLVPHRAEFADVNGDTLVDQVTILHNPIHGLAVQLGDAQGGFGPEIPSLAPGVEGWDLRVADLDGDSIPDVAALDGGGFYSAHGYGDGTFAPPTPTLAAPGESYGDIELADVDADGDLDAYVMRFYQPYTIRVMINPGAGPFFLGGAAMFAATTFIDGDLAVADLNADGFVDATTLNGNNNDATFAFADGLGGFTHVVSQSMGKKLDAGTYADVDADGLQDLVAHAGGDQTLSVWRGNGGASFQPSVATPMPRLAQEPARVIDMDADGTLDVVAAVVMSGTTRHVAFARGTGTASFEPARLFSAHNKGYEFGVFDANLDGAQDVVFASDYFAAQSDIATVSSLTRCAGEIGVHGDPCIGSGGFLPRLAITGCALPGETLEVRLVDALGGSMAFLLPGVPGPSLAIGSSGCALHLNPLSFVPIVVPLTGVGAGAGSLHALVALPPSVSNATAEVQAFVVDAGVAAGFATTNAVTVVIR